MSRSEQIFAAVDVGTTKIVVLAGKKNAEGRIEVIGFGHSKSQGIKRGVVLNIDEAYAAIQEAVRKAEKAFNGDIEELYVNITGQQLHTITSTGELMLAPETIVTEDHVTDLFKQARQISMDEDAFIYHINPQSFTVDSESGILNPVGSLCEKLEGTFKVHVAPELYQRNIQKCLDRGGINMRKAILDPIASAEVVLSEDEKEAGVILVDIGGGTTKMSVFHEGVLCHTSLIPFGGNVITHDIKEGCSIILRLAESLKVQYGQAIGDFAPEDKVVTIPAISGWEPKEITFKNLAYIIQARMEEIVDAVFYQLEKSGYLDKVGAGIVLTGGTALMQNIRQLIKFRTGLDVRHGNPGLQDFVAWKELEDPRYSTVLGLLKMAVSEADESAKPMIRNRRRKKEKSSENGFFATVKSQVAKQVTLFFEEDQDVEMY